MKILLVSRIEIIPTMRIIEVVEHIKAGSITQEQLRDYLNQSGVRS